MAIQQVTEPPILDTTGLRIAQSLEEIRDAVQPTNSCIDIDISLPGTGWTGNGPYTYTYNNAHITTGCKVKVNFLETESASGGILYLEYEKVVGGIQFTAKSVPTAQIPVRIHILNADAESIMATTADEVSTNAVTGASNVEQALGLVGGNVAEVNNKVGNVPEGETVEGQIASLNSNIKSLDAGTYTLILKGGEFSGATGVYRFIHQWTNKNTSKSVTINSISSGSTTIDKSLASVQVTNDYLQIYSTNAAFNQNAFYSFNVTVNVS